MPLTTVLAAARGAKPPTSRTNSRAPNRPAVGSSARLEKEDGHLAEVKVDEMLCLVRHVGSKVTPDDGMPSRVVLLVELLLDEGRNVLLNVVLLQCLRCAVDRILLHVLGHVRVLDHCLPVRHGCVMGREKRRHALRI